MTTDIIAFGEPTRVLHKHTVYGFEWERDGAPMLRIQVADVRNDGDAIYGEFTVWWLLDQPVGVRPIQPQTVLKMNSSHSTGWRSIPRELARRITNVDWEEAMTIVVNDVMTKYKEGTPNVRLGTKGRSVEPPFLVAPWVASSGITVMYGEGGLSKSLISLAMALSVSTGVPIFGQEPIVVGPVMYFDYEDDWQVHEDRMHAICRSFGIPLDAVEVYHHALSAKVTTSIQEMARRAHDVGAVLGVLDSVGMGRGGSAVASEDTIRMFRALRTIGVPFLCIDHVSKEAKADQKKGKTVDPYGTVYTMNQARLGWALTRSSHSGDPSGSFRVYAQNTKHNHVPRQMNRSMRIQYRNDEHGVPEFIDIETGNDFGMLMPGVDNAQRLAMLLSDGKWWTYKEMEESLDIKSGTLRSIVSRDGDERYETKGVAGGLTKVRMRSKTGAEPEGVAEPLQHPLQHPPRGEESE